jgi:Uma2 family endonuclease
MKAALPCYPRIVVRTLDRLADLAPERVRPLLRVEYERLIAGGSFDEERVELLGGAIVEMSPQSERHSKVVTRLASLLVQAAGQRASVRVQMPFAASPESLPEPDIAVVPLIEDEDARPEEALLIVEVSDASLRKDRTLKAELYARAGVPEYWIVNLIGLCIEVHTAPVNGAYTRLETFAPGASIPFAPLGATIAVSDVIR